MLSLSKAKFKARSLTRKPQYLPVPKSEELKLLYDQALRWEIVRRDAAVSMVSGDEQRAQTACGQWNCWSCDGSAGPFQALPGSMAVPLVVAGASVP